jgi:hypothetical protein
MVSGFFLRFDGQRGRRQFGRNEQEESRRPGRLEQSNQVLNIKKGQ